VADLKRDTNRISKYAAAAFAIGAVCAVGSERVEAMQNPFLGDLRSVAVACDGEGAQSWCRIAAELIKADMNVPVSIVDASTLPLNQSGLPSPNHVWVTLSARQSGDNVTVSLSWGSAMRMQGVGTGHATQMVGTMRELKNKAVWRKVLSTTPFVSSKK
jgi:hypothetical protein